MCRSLLVLSSWRLKAPSKLACQSSLQQHVAARTCVAGERYTTPVIGKRKAGECAPQPMLVGALRGRSAICNVGPTPVPRLRRWPHSSATKPTPKPDPAAVTDTPLLLAVAGHQDKVVAALLSKVRLGGAYKGVGR
jgi:hypothetical protein